MKGESIEVVRRVLSLLNENEREGWTFVRGRG